MHLNQTHFAGGVTNDLSFGRIADYPNLSAVRRWMLDMARVADTVNFQQIKRHYYASLRGVNPSGAAPVGPEVAL